MVAEEPLEIRLAWPGSPAQRVWVTMRTPGHDFELAAGWLVHEGRRRARRPAHGGVLHRRGPHAAAGVQRRHRDPRRSPARDPAHRHVAASTGSLGLRGLREGLGRGRPRHPAGRAWTGPLPHPDVVRTLPDRLREEQPVFGETGGVHAAGLATADGELLVVREDVGRHNAVDKVTGARVLAGDPVADACLVVSGRAGFELVQKAVAAGVGSLVAVGAPTSPRRRPGPGGRARPVRVHPATAPSATPDPRVSSAPAQVALAGSTRWTTSDCDNSRRPDALGGLPLALRPLRPHPPRAARAAPVTGSWRRPRARADARGASLGVGPRRCRRRPSVVRRADPPHLRLAPRAGPSTARGCSAPRPRTSTTCSTSSSPSRSTSSSSPATSTTGRSRRSTRCALADEAFARLAASRAQVVRHQRQPRLRPAARLRLPADRRRRRPRPHRRRRGRHARCCSRTRTARSPSTASPTSTPTRCASRGSCPAAPTRPPSPRRWRRVRADLGRAPSGTRSVVLAHAFVAGGAAQRLRARHQRRRGLDGARRRSSTASTTPRSATCTAAHTLTDARPLQRLAAGLLLLRGRPAQGLLAGRPRRRRRRRRRVRRGAGPAAAGRGCAATSTTLLDRPRPRRPRGRLGPGDPDRRRPPGAGDGAAARAGSRTPSSLALRAARPASRRRPAGARTAGAPTTTIALDFVADLRGAPATAAESALLRDARATPAATTPTSTPLRRREVTG